ncbi:hypothetical protein GOODEAATRI_009711 [Goodea atripinnis]|uniref:Uncharacterized protein n=1 Tax=Goodea atripinnis TaxID=208336 RepID=A0ABV0N9C8_9TELE
MGYGTSIALSVSAGTVDIFLIAKTPQDSSVKPPQPRFLVLGGSLVRTVFHFPLQPLFSRHAVGSAFYHHRMSEAAVT